MTGPLRVLSYNCRGLRLGQGAGDRAHRLVIDNLLENCDILCLQETFLAKQDLAKLNILDVNFHGAGESTTDLSWRIIRGRIPGGVAILWNKRLDLLVNVLRLDVDWCIGVQLSYSGRELIILNVYTPYECIQNEAEYLNRLAFIYSFIQCSNTSCIYVIGDMNADIADRNSLFANHMIQFCQDNSLKLSSQEFLPSNTYTYISEAWHTASWLDHCISTDDAHSSIVGMDILYGAATYDHMPVLILINVEDIPMLSCDSYDCNTEFLDWSALSREDIAGYYADTNRLLSKISLPSDAIRCSDPTCNVWKHREEISSLYDYVVRALYESSRPYFKRKNKMGKMRPGWNKYVAGYHEEAKLAFKSWVLAGRPRQGPLFEQKKNANTAYKYAVRFIGKNEQAMRAESMAEKVMDNNNFGRR